MGAIGGMLGLGGGAAGTGFDKPQQAQITGMPGTQEQQGAALGNLYERNLAALASQQRLNAALQEQGGLQKQTGVFNQLQDVAAGRGPNPAQAMLNQQTGTNVANQAALMAGQRGASQNVGLMARQAAQQGGNLQQQAVGQGATMQANQSLNALGQLGGMANTMVANRMAGETAATGAEQASFNNLANVLNAQNQARVASQSSVNQANAGLAGQQMQNQKGLVGGILSGVGNIIGLNHGGEVGYAGGGDTSPSSGFGQFLAGMNSGGNVSGGNMVDVVLSPGEKVVPPGEVQAAVGGNVQAKTVPGQAKVAGDSVKNDTYKTKLPEGSIVVPRTKSNNARDAAAFVRAVLAKRGKK